MSEDTHIPPIHDEESLAEEPLSFESQNCPDCGHDTLDFDMLGDFCQNPNCDFDNRSEPETPEGGWPRGSDMDRL